MILYIFLSGNQVKNRKIQNKFKNFFLSGRAVQKLSDLICIENSLSVIEPKPYSERIKMNRYKDSVSKRDIIRKDIELALLQKPKNLEEILKILSRKGYEVVENYSHMIEEPTFDDAKQLSNRLLADFTKGEIGEIYVAYTEFKNTVTHIPKLVKLLPVEANDVTEDEEMSAIDKITPMNFEPSEEEAIALLIPKYVTSILYGAFVEAVASENGARMQAMDSATNNAEEIINDLELKYNRARQGAITQELTEIIAGAEAIG